MVPPLRKATVNGDHYEPNQTTTVKLRWCQDNYCSCFYVGLNLEHIFDVN